VQTWASRHDDGRLAVLLWVSTLDQSKRDGDPALARRVRLTIEDATGRSVRVTRLDREHGDITTLAAALGVAEWPTDEQWTALRAADSLTVETAADGVLELHLPQPGAVLVEIE
jgi:xylan 1,4-beta-xylosidase